MSGLQPPVVVSADDHDAFPGVAWSNGTYVVTYQHATGRGITDGVARAKTSTDGITWSAPTTIFNDPTYHVAATAVTKMASGRIVALIHVTLFGGGDLQNGAFTTYTDDKSGSWSTPAQIDSDFTSVSRAEGRIAELPDGSWLLGVFGRDTGDNPDDRSVRAILSSDAGENWVTVGSVADGETDGRNYNGTGMIQDGSPVIAFVRENLGTPVGGGMWRSTSTDGGDTWTPVAAVSIPGVPTLGGISNPFIRASGKMMIVWRDIRSEFNYPQYVFESDDSGVTWAIWDELYGVISAYGAIAEDSNERLAVAWGVEDGFDTNDGSTIYFALESPGDNCAFDSGFSDGFALLEACEPFSDDFPGNNGDPWNTDKWNQDAGSGGGDTTIIDNRGNAKGSEGNANSGGRGKGKQGQVPNQEMTGTFQLCEVNEPCNGALWLQTSNDWSGLDWPTEGYGVRLPSNSDTATLLLASGGTVAELDAATWPRDAGLKQFRFRRQSQRVRFRIWDDGDPEPTDWLLSANDSTITPDDPGAFQIAYTCPSAPSVDACADFDTVRVGENDTPIPDSNGGGSGNRMGGDRAIRRSPTPSRASR